MATLICFSTPGGRLTYDDHDIVNIHDAAAFPGKALVANEGGDWSFLYIVDREPTDPEVRNLLAPWEGDLIDPNEPELGREMLGKRRYTLQNLPQTPDGRYRKYHPLDEAPEDMKAVWSAVLVAMHDKAGA